MTVLLTLTWAGRVIRLSQRHLDVLDEVSGRWYHYHAGLPLLDLTDAQELLAEGAPEQLQIETILPVDVASLIERGHTLQGAVAEVAVYSGSYRDRDVVLLGYVSEPRWRPGVGLVTMTISADAIDSTSLWPPESAVISADTWTSYDPINEGRTYPWIIGSPGTWRRSGATAGISGSPAYVVEGHGGGAGYRDVLLAGHACAAETLVNPSPARITLRDETTGVEDDFSVFYAWLQRTGGAPGYDLMGRWCLVARMAAVAGQAQLVRNAPYVDGNVLTARWHRGESAGVPLYGASATPMEMAGDVLRWALDLAGLPVDWRRCAAASHLLRDYRLAGYWDDRCSPYRWVRDQLLPLLPVSLMHGPHGLYPVVWRWWAGRELAIRHLEIGRSCAYVEGPTVGSEGWSRPQEVAVRYARSAAAGMTHRGAQVIRATRPDAARIGSDLATRRAKLEVDEPPAESIDADLVTDGVTAGLIARARVQLWSVAAPTVTVRVPSDLALSPGDVVTLTWPAVTGVVRRPCVITRRVRRGVAADLTLRMTLGRIYR